VFEWFCYVERAIFTMTGIADGQHQWSPLHTFGYTLLARYQMVGAVIALAVVFLWSSQRELAGMVRAAFPGRPGRGVGREHRAVEGIPWWTFWALIIGVAAYLFWTTAAGMRLYVSIVLLFFFLVFAVIAARVVAATGFLWVYDYFLPMNGLSDSLGPARIDPQSWSNVALVNFTVLNHRANTMPQTLDGMKIVRETGIRQHHFFIGMAVGVVVAMIVSCAVVIRLGYTYGGQNLEPYHFRGGVEWVFDRVAGFQRYHLFTNWTAIGCMTAGAAFMGLLMYLHRTFLWWPLYPLGFAIGGTIATGQIWFPVFVGWLLKTLVVRFSGAPTYHRLKSVALGLVLGEFVCVGMWLVIDALTGTTLHKVFPAWAMS